ncbi:TPA: Ref family recombination enhancement nuclease [Klebsiella aerogenes]|nr:hypothetical protein [Klebsiella aerogenes]
MNGRHPTKKERLYIHAVLNYVGCIACIIDGREIDNPQLWTELHHDPDYGSTAKNCHFHAFGLCVPHHRGVAPGGGRVPPEVAVRHPPLSNCARFAEQYGSDEYLCARTWELVPHSVKEKIGFDLSLGELPEGNGQ